MIETLTDLKLNNNLEGGKISEKVFEVFFNWNFYVIIYIKNNKNTKKEHLTSKLFTSSIKKMLVGVIFSYSVLL